MTYVPPNVTESNPDGIIYLKGDEFTDESIRLMPDERNPKDAEIQHRSSGVWNTTGLSLGALSLLLGRAISLGAYSTWMQTTTTDHGIASVIPNQAFTDDGSDFPHVPRLHPLIVKFLLLPFDSDEFAGTFLSMTFPVPGDVLLSKFYFKTGSIGATEPVDFRIIAGLPGIAPSPIIFEQTFPPEVFPANSDISFDLVGNAQALFDAVWTFEAESDAPISLLGSIPLGVWHFSVDGRFIIPEELLVDNFTFNRDGNIMMTKSLDFVVGRRRLPGAA